MLTIKKKKIIIKEKFLTVSFAELSVEKSSNLTRTTHGQMSIFSHCGGVCMEVSANKRKQCKTNTRHFSSGYTFGLLKGRDAVPSLSVVRVVDTCTRGRNLYKYNTAVGITWVHKWISLFVRSAKASSQILMKTICPGLLVVAGKTERTDSTSPARA